ncbi:MAG: sulfotransferase, partial [Pseudomonadota bacterium]
MADTRRLTHPLCGANLATLAKATRRGGFPTGRGLPQYLIAWGAAIGRLPFTLGERVYAKLKAPKDIAPPIFILGHWRSGTTHLYNILAKSEQFGFVTPFATALPWDILSIGTLMRPLLERSLPKHRYIDNVAVDAAAPQEDEIALANMTADSYYHALYFPQAFQAFFDRGVFFKHLGPA